MTWLILAFTVTATLSWQQASNGVTITGHRIEQQIDLGAWTTTTTVSRTAKSTRVTAQGGKVYCYRVIALGGTGESAPSDVICKRFTIEDVAR